MSMHSVYINDRAADLFRCYIYEILDLLHVTRSEFAKCAGITRQMMYSYVEYKTRIRVLALNGMLFALTALTTNAPSDIDTGRILGMIQQIIDASDICLQVDDLNLGARRTGSYVSRRCPPIEGYWTIAQYRHLCEMNVSEVTCAIKHGHVKVTKINGHNYIPKSQPYLKVVRKRPQRHPGIRLEFAPAEEKGE